jgi:hypothetical protein
VNIAADVLQGREFDQWIGDVAYIADVHDPTTTVTMPAANITVTATFKTTAGELENVALNKTVINSSGSEAVNPPSGSMDGSTAILDRWSASGLQTNPQWMEIDLGDIYSISSTELVSLEDRAYQFTVEVKTTLDGNYTQVVDRSSNATPGTVAEPITDNFSATPARYVKITVAGAASYTGDWCSLVEFRVFGE